MKHQTMKLKNLLVAACAGILLFVAGTALADEASVKFPDRDSSYMKEGTFVAIENLRNMGPGLTKTQVYDLLGVPHFHEGIFHVRTWNYIFNFRLGSEVVSCQYQVQYSDQKLVQSTYWNKPECADFLQKKKITAPEQIASIAPEKVQRYSLAGDTLFSFGHSSLESMLPAGMQQLDNLIKKIKADNVAGDKILVTGHTDRIGSDDYNLRLSYARAATVRDYLASHGIDRNLVEIRGAGSGEPVTSCPSGSGAAVIACLQPNRRVTLDVSGERQ